MNWFIENMGYQENYLPFYQAELGNEVLVLCSRGYPKKRKFIKGNRGDIDYADRPLRIKRLKSLSVQFLAEQNWYLGLKREINDFKPDIIHLHNIWDLPSLELLIINFADKKKTKILVDNHTDNGNFNYKNIYKFVYYFGFIKKIVIPAMLKKDLMFISVNPYSCYFLNSYFGIPKEKISFLPLGIDSEKIFFSESERQILRKKYAITNEAIVFVFSGVFEQSKSLPDLITAFKTLAKKYAHIFLLMIGKGNLPKDNGFQRLREKGRIILCGWQPTAQLYRWYSMADIGVMPGKLGGIKDILSAARPLIVNDDLATSYLLEYNNGLKFRRGNIEELAYRMEAYIKNPDLIQKHGEKSLQLVKERLSWKNIARQSLNIYNGALN